MYFFFSTEKLALLTVITVEGVKPSPDRKIKKNSQHLITCFHHYDILATENSLWNDDGYHVFPPK